MPLGRELTPLWLTDKQREQLEAWSRSTSMPHGLDLRARIILTSAGGLTSTAVARKLGISLPTVGKWRKRFLDFGGSARRRPTACFEDRIVVGSARRAAPCGHIQVPSNLSGGHPCVSASPRRPCNHCQTVADSTLLPLWQVQHHPVSWRAAPVKRRTGGDPKAGALPNQGRHVPALPSRRLDRSQTVRSCPPSPAAWRRTSQRGADRVTLVCSGAAARAAPLQEWPAQVPALQATAGALHG